jgi:hypothetical protein
MIEVNDIIRATLQDGKSTAVQNFTVSEIDGTKYLGGALECDTANGWVVEILRKNIDNLALPETLSEIRVTDRSNRVHELVGKGTAWRDSNGNLFDVANIISWSAV